MQANYKEKSFLWAHLSGGTHPRTQLAESKAATERHITATETWMSASVCCSPLFCLTSVWLQPSYFLPLEQAAAYSLSSSLLSVCSRIVVEVSSSFYSALFIYFKGSCTERDLPTTGSFPNSHMAKAELRNLELQLGLLHECWGSSIWTTLCCFPRCISRELKQKWSSQNVKWQVNLLCHDADPSHISASPSESIWICCCVLKEC